jgi:hypothetical protein
MAKIDAPIGREKGYWLGRCVDVDGIGCGHELCVSYLVGGRDLGWAKEFMRDCASRIRNRVQITTDGHKSYP